METPKLKSVIRLDSIRMDKAYYTPEGFLIDKPIVTGVGIFEYTNSDGSIRRELRLPEEVFDPESLKSYKSRPIVLTHDAGLINKENVRDNQIGTILSEGFKDGANVRAEIVIHDTDEMKRSGLKELSLGYNLDLDETPGEWNGTHYDAIQRNIRINHLALVREARAGEKARLNIDSRDSDYALRGGIKMGASKVVRNAKRNDDVLSQPELEKAIEEYRAKHPVKTDAEEVEVKEAEVTSEPTIEDKVKGVIANRDRRDECGDPKNEEEALTAIAHQDEDIDTLLNIIDTLLAERDFKANKDAEEKPVEEIPVEEEVVEEEVIEEPKKDSKSVVGGVDDMERVGKIDAEGEEEEMLPEDDEMVEDADDTEIPEDEEIVEEEEVVEDADDTEDVIEDEPVDEEEPMDDEMDGCCGGKMRKDSMDSMISRSIRNHMIMGNLGRKVGINGLEYKDIKSAKKAIIHKVNPDMRLDGKTDSYIDSAFNMARAEIKRNSVKGTASQKKQMFNKDSRVETVDNSASAARNRMIAKQLKK